MVNRSVGSNGFEVVAVATLRAQQLMSGCRPRLLGTFKATTMAQMEVAAGKVARVTDGVMYETLRAPRR